MRLDLCRGSLAGSVTAPLQANAIGAIIARQALAIGSRNLLRGLLLAAGLFMTASTANHCAGRCANRGTLASIAGDRTDPQPKQPAASQATTGPP